MRKPDRWCTWPMSPSQIGSWYTFLLYITSRLLPINRIQCIRLYVAWMAGIRNLISWLFMHVHIWAYFVWFSQTFTVKYHYIMESSLNSWTIHVFYISFAKICFVHCMMWQSPKGKRVLYIVWDDENCEKCFPSKCPIRNNKSKGCFIIVSFIIERASRNYTNKMDPNGI